jgi:hypothetical protein
MDQDAGLVVGVVSVPREVWAAVNDRADVSRMGEPVRGDQSRKSGADDEKTHFGKSETLKCILVCQLFRLSAFISRRYRPWSIFPLFREKTYGWMWVVGWVLRRAEKPGR